MTTDPRGPLAWSPLDSRAPVGPLWVAISILFVLSLLAGLTGDVPYYAIAPGSAVDITELVSAPPDKSFPTKGSIFLTTVSVGPEKALQAIRDWLDDDVDVVPEKAILGTSTRKQFQQQNVEAIDDSKQTAVVVGLRRLGYDVAEHGQGALVEAVVEESPADGHLKVGDVIVGVDGQPVTLQQQARDLIAAHTSPTPMQMEIEPGDGTAKRSDEVELVRRADGTPLLGVLLRTKALKFDLPFDVKIDSLGIVGPSAGLAFTLEVIDRLSPGELTGGIKVAATGEIGIDGTVGPIGGVAQKTAAVRKQGVKVFIVPLDNAKDARRRAGSSVKIIPVRNLDEAITALGKLGGDVSALGPPGSTAGAR